MDCSYQKKFGPFQEIPLQSNKAVLRLSLPALLRSFSAYLINFMGKRQILSWPLVNICMLVHYYYVDRVLKITIFLAITRVVGALRAPPRSLRLPGQNK